MDYLIMPNYIHIILAFDEEQTAIPKTTACIRCGACVNVCPFGINPPAIAKALKNEDFEILKEVGANLCMECGCCSFNCPAARPLVQTNKMAKAAYRDYMTNKNKEENK